MKKSGEEPDGIFRLLAAFYMTYILNSFLVEFVML